MPFKLVKKTVRGETLVGRVANKILPFPQARDAIGAAIKGTKQGLPVPEFEEAEENEKIQKALNYIESCDGADENDLIHIVQNVYDILHDGKANQSRSLSPEVRKIIIKSFSALPILAYLAYAIISGDFSLSSLIEAIGSL